MLHCMSCSAEQLKINVFVRCVRISIPSSLQSWCTLLSFSVTKFVTSSSTGGQIYNLTLKPWTLKIVTFDSVQLGSTPPVSTVQLHCVSFVLLSFQISPSRSCIHPVPHNVLVSILPRLPPSWWPEQLCIIEQSMNLLINIRTVLSQIFHCTLVRKKWPLLQWSVSDPC